MIVLDSMGEKKHNIRSPAMSCDLVQLLQVRYPVHIQVLSSKKTHNRHIDS